MKKLHLLILTLCSALLFTTACVGGGDLVDNKPVNKEEQEKPDPEPENPDNTDDPNDPGETPPADEVFPFISSDPKFITADMTTDVIVYLNTEGTTMDNFKGDIYAHTGVLTSASTSSGGSGGGSSRITKSSGSNSGGSKKSSSSGGTTISDKKTTTTKKSNEPEIDMKSVLALGYGPISESRLSELVDNGLVSMYVVGDKVKFKHSAAYVKQKGLMG